MRSMRPTADAMKAPKQRRILIEAGIRDDIRRTLPAYEHGSRIIGVAREGDNQRVAMV